MHGHLGSIKLSIHEFVEAMSDDNRFFTARAQNKRSEDVTVEELLAHYVANTSEPRISPDFHEEDPLFIG